MELNLYTNNDDNKVVTKNITTLVTLNGILRDDCSIIDPVIMISSDSFNNAMAAVCNYAMIPEFGRYYFVKNITLTGKFWVIEMHVDVLASFQTQLKALDAVVARQENEYNLYLQDGMFRTYQNPNISVLPFGGAFDTYQYILMVAGA